ncbi:pyridoxine 5'-phosphate synthase [Leptospira interrogans]|uniref:Pyridoxine 5'-phosphate synthase n=1 Tax=Leptospira interrogans serovar Lora str. TE 1992 TaxID=1193028 RepID=M3CLU3_LEPIR|nr:pyridoxine 5'-phosphate synthase [Leptospira interrogans]EMF42454.1 pyridoxine 5'-phosphate synthase [Leptospira interrogans serovar Lora str. TE 1992]KAA1266655.1 pyridoxine 5'-phosphate synthase [Leptospira interrogans serovar Weerasinghe]KAA1293293.1 pyridoxine 5'-phosphate synthase [Leptospira interrogans serovar Geyaweera]AKH77703.1 pyridoxine 5'-phosphate synthase [Leptospira interrogans serovar Bratislava]EMJ47639.1 pyridoxine 5'-phosphate synthase [Leptospira interrogans str. UT126]
MKVKLSVNINKIATLRNSRGGNIPDLLYFANLVLKAGAHGITVHPREDERHIRKEDVFVLKEFIDSYNRKNNTNIEYNLEGEPSPRFLDLVLKTKPDQATLVPVTPGEITSDHGFDFEKDMEILSEYSKILKKDKIRVSLFVETGLKNLKLASLSGADRVEFYTGPFAEAFDHSPQIGKKRFETEYVPAATEILNQKMGINAGHDLDHENLKIFSQLPGLQEVSIGHRLISRALETGIDQSVKDYLQALS